MREHLVTIFNHIEDHEEDLFVMKLDSQFVSKTFEAVWRHCNTGPADKQSRKTILTDEKFKLKEANYITDKK